MGRDTSFSLNEHECTFIEEQVASGRYRSAGELLHAALRLLEDRETSLHALREDLITGETSGESTPFDFDEFVSRNRAAGSASLTARIPAGQSYCGECGSPLLVAGRVQPATLTDPAPRPTLRIHDGVDAGELLERLRDEER